MRTVFRRRWRALWWSAGVLVTAYCAVPSKDDDSVNPPAPQATANSAHPWAKDALTK